jgi:IS30 family transposase
MCPISLAPLSGRSLSLAEREEIAIERARGSGVREIARHVGRSPSTISRELRRNAATRADSSGYRATVAHWHAERRRRRPKVAKLVSNEKLHDYVADRLSGLISRPDGTEVEGPTVRFKGRRHGPRQDRRWAKAWSPEQISRRLVLDFPDDETMRISHEAISQSLFVQGRGALKRELVTCLRTGRALRVPRARAKGRGKNFITPEVMISERPAEIEDRAVPGHWEGDLIIGLDKSAIGTLVERTTRFTMLLHLPPDMERSVKGRGWARRTGRQDGTGGAGGADRWQRRLATLICAGRNRRAVVRPKLPPTSCAGPDRRPGRIGVPRILRKDHVRPTQRLAQAVAVMRDQQKPASSRATAVAATVGRLPRLTSRQ